MNLKSCFASLSLLAASLCAFAPSAQATVASVDTTYYFSGKCGDCTGTGYGTLVLQNYTAGTALSTNNFVSFNYTSNLLPSYSFAGDTLVTFNGSIGAATGPYGVFLDGTGPNSRFDDFISNLNGSWCTGQGCLADYGTNGVWSTVNPNTPPPAVTPEPATLSLLGTGIAGIVALRRRR